MTDLETLEAIRSDADALELVLRLAAMSKAGTLQPFVAEMHQADVDEETLMLVRVAALVAVGAPAVSYGLNLRVAGAMGIDPEKLRGVLAAVAPIVGTARVAAATGNIVKALAVAIEVAELDAQDEV